jgi:hypothetical protein
MRSEVRAIFAAGAEIGVTALQSPPLHPMGFWQRAPARMQCLRQAELASHGTQQDMQHRTRCYAEGWKARGPSKRCYCK